ncbi:MAG: FMN-binding protein [Candidatus Saccharibacteria bacterium]|nr:FMN-binding protein [Candidatus Saccharibacteria bacterium]
MNTSTMKKLGLSAFVILTFVAYSLTQRQDSKNTAVVAPTTTTQGTSPSSSSTPSSGTTYKDGSYTGTAADAYYGYIQVKAIISGGKLTDVIFLQYPNDRENSVSINQQAMPYLKQEAIQAQSAHVNTISGASDTSQAFVQSLTSALNQAA